MYKYEKCMDTYAKPVKKIQNGDRSAYAEYMRYMKEAQSLAEEADKYRGDMSSAQIARLGRIASKMAGNLWFLTSYNCGSAGEIRHCFFGAVVTDLVIFEFISNFAME